MLLRKIILALFIAQAAAADLTNGLYAAFDTSMGSFTCRLDYAGPGVGPVTGQALVTDQLGLEFAQDAFSS